MATIVISMLRGVNVGSHRRMKMEALRRVYESLGLEFCGLICRAAMSSSRLESAT